MQQQILMQEVLDQSALSETVSLVWFIFKMTLGMEAVGALALMLAWWGHFDSVAELAFQAVFHAVSAFCNAGFTTIGDGLLGFAGDIATNLILMLLVIAGGLGFFVILDISENFNRHRRGLGRGVPRLKVQTRIVIFTTFLLGGLGFLAIYGLEYSHALADVGLKEKVLVAFFQSIASRTAGFNTCDIAAFSPPTLLLITVLMFIGGAPGSCAGGIKTTTLAVLWATLVSGFRQIEQVELFRRTIPATVVQKALVLAMVSVAIVVSFVVMLLVVHPGPLLPLLFETVSAFGTVGLSLGVTPELGGVGKALIVVLMFIGRVGTLTVFSSLIIVRRAAEYRYAEERVMIG
jgi:trk system potassium uptake protein TrkH